LIRSTRNLAVPIATLWVCCAAAETNESAQFIATANCLKGTTASGAISSIGIVAADTSILPMGTRIRITRAGRYSGEYTVRDRGKKVKGRKLDIYMPTYAEAKRFGRRKVLVEIIRENLTGVRSEPR
jgi:3D (Asp-Asp-Asp) domain-containing protein